MGQIQRGLYETLVTRALASALSDVDAELVVHEAGLHEAEAADRLTLHLRQVLMRALGAVSPDDRVRVGTALIQELIRIAVAETRADSLVGEMLANGEAPGVLRSVLRRLPDGTSEQIPSPATPLLDTTLLSNSPGEPRLIAQLSSELASADQVDITMAFVRRTGIIPLRDGLGRLCERGGRVRLLTTTYTGSTEAAALEWLRDLGVEVKVSYDTSGTRLHAKAWLFHRRSGFSTAFIGSSNLTHSAQVTGMEWNVRVSGARNREVIDKFSAIFESYWASGDFEPFDSRIFRERTQTASRDGGILLSPLEVRPEPFQQHLLEQIALSRQQGWHRNLLVSATGTGKTVMAALDYATLRTTLPRARLLFVAHRKEILQQSLATFRHALRDHAFGELWVDGARPTRFEHVFASVQSLSANGFEHIGAQDFDVIIIDEFHHAAAASYRHLLDSMRPVELLGLTATPERSDGLPLLHWFGGRIAAELRLWDAIEQRRLVPFQYFGVHDGTDLKQLPWKRGQGYDVEGLSRLYTGNDVWARFVLQQIAERVESPATMRALGFCVSVEHSRFMARLFTEAGIQAKAIWADTPSEERATALRELASGAIQVIFSVDIFNEGVDVPAVDTVLLLRPTDSSTLFLQQLGRGLRRYVGKTLCTVLDFVGLHRAEFRFERRFRALLGGTRKHLLEQVEGGFPLLPAGCHMELDRVARDIVLQNIRNSVPTRWQAKVSSCRNWAAARPNHDLADFLEQSGLELEDIYANNKCWSDLCGDAGLPLASAGPCEAALRRACGRLLHVDDPSRINTWARWLQESVPPSASTLSAREAALLRMLVQSMLGGASQGRDLSLADGCALLWQHGQVRNELLQCLRVLQTRLTHITSELSSHPAVPLCVHARYTRVEILAACGVNLGAASSAWQTGVYWAKAMNADLLAFTLDKTQGHFSPTMRYQDYAISQELIHWESQSAVREASDTGQRYQNHSARGSSVLLFARENTEERAFWFLGTAEYVSHVGELPMAVTWRLKQPLPGDLFATFAAAVA